MLKPRRLLVLSAILFILILPFPVALADEPGLARYPYVQSVTTTTAIVAWKTNIAGDSSVDFGLTSKYGFTVTVVALTTNHALTLTGLSPGTTYHYRIKSGGRPLSLDEVFRTAPASQDSPFSFVVFGDSGDGGPNTMKTANLVKDLNPDFLIHTGDINYPRGEESTFDHRFFLPYRDTLRSKPVYPALGNHDVLTDSGRPWLDAFYLSANNMQATERYYSFDYANAHFVALEVVEDEPLSTDQINWLIADLLKTSKTWKFVYFHVPPYSSSRHGSALQVRKSLSPLLEWFQVDLVFNGHDHNYERTVPVKDFYPDKRGVTYIVTGGGGDGVYPSGASSFTAYSESAFHVTNVQIDGSVLTLKAVRNDGSAMDSLSIQKGTKQRVAVEVGERVEGTGPAAKSGAVVVCSASVTSLSQCDYRAGGNNDQAIINSSIREGKHVMLSEGTFRLSDSIVIANNRVMLSGAGPGTVLQVTANGVAAIRLTAAEDVLIRDLTIDGNKSVYERTRGIYIDGNATLQLDSLRITNTNSGQPTPTGVLGSALASFDSHSDFRGNYRRRITGRNLHLKDNIGGMLLFDTYDSSFTNVTIEAGSASEGVAWAMNRAYQVSLQNFRISTAGGYAMQIMYFKDLNLSNIVAEGGEVNVIDLLGGPRGHSANANLTNVIAFNGGVGSDGIDIDGVTRLNMSNIVAYNNGSDGIEIEGEPRNTAATEISLNNVQSYGNGRAGLHLINVRRGWILGGSFINNGTSYNGISQNDSAGVILSEGTRNVVVMGATIGDTQATEPVAIVEAKAGQQVLQLSSADPPGGARVFFPDQKVTIVDDKNRETNLVVRSYTIGPYHFLELKNRLAASYASNATVSGAPTQHYGIEERDAPTYYNSFLFNNFTGNISGAVRHARGASGNNDCFLGNRGYLDTHGSGIPLPVDQR